MKRVVAAWGGILLLLLARAALFVKGDTIRIVISGGTLSAPIKISSPAAVYGFNVRSGPGTGSNDAEGLNAFHTRLCGDDG